MYADPPRSGSRRGKWKGRDMMLSVSHRGVSGTSKMAPRPSQVPSTWKCASAWSEELEYQDPSVYTRHRVVWPKCGRRKSVQAMGGLE